MGIHVHGLGAIAPAGGDGDGRADTLALEFLSTGCTLADTSDGGVADDALHLRAVAITQVLLNQVIHCLGQIHGLLLQPFADTALATVYGRADTDFRIVLFHCC